MEICPFKDYLETCNGSILKDNSVTVVLTEKGVAKIKYANEVRGTNVIVEKGSIVHKKCKVYYTNNNNLQTIKRRKTVDGYM